MIVGSERATPQLTTRGQASSARKDGALVIIDNFQSSESHGHLVQGSAATLGPTGPVYTVHQHQMVNGRPTLPHVEALRTFQAGMGETLSPELAGECFERFVGDAAGGNLAWATKLLSAVTAEGFQHSVLNYSQGLDAIILLQLLKHPTGASSKLAQEQKQMYAENLARAVAPEATHTLSEPELDNAVLQKLKRTLKESPVVREATQNWAAQVREFEGGHNSVVVAAGNSGVAQKAITRAGFDIDGSEDVNIFAIPEVTMVGATTLDKGGEALAAPSSFGPEVDFLASGDFGEHFGTSFACPKVANALRAAHLANPEFSSDQAEQWAKEELAYSGQLGEQQVAILDANRARSLIRIQS